jgi:hypothetical protein
MKKTSKEQAVENPTAHVENTAPTETPKAESLARFGFKHLLTKPQKGENIFDFLAKNQAQNNESFTDLLSGLLVNLSASVKRSKSGDYSPTNWEFVYELYYVGFLWANYSLKRESEKGETEMYPLDKYLTNSRETNGSRHPLCGGCRQTPRVAMKHLAQQYIQSEYYKNQPIDAKKVFPSSEEYAKFIQGA